MKNSSLLYKIIIAALIVTNITTYFVAKGHRNVHEHLSSHENKHPMLDPALPLYDNSDLIVNVQSLRDYLQALPDQNKDWADMSIYFEVMNTGANISVNNDLKLWPASLVKLPVGMILMKKVEKGEWSLDDTKLTLVKEDADVVHTPEVANGIGQSFTLQFLLEKLLLESDNTAFHMIVRELSEDELLSIANEVGLQALFTQDQKIGAKDYSRLLRSLYLATYLNEEHSEKLLDLLENSKFDKFLRAGIPYDVEIAHKWGINEEQNVYADSGIVYVNNRPYMLSVMIQGKGNDQKSDQVKAEQLIKDIGEHSYKFMVSQ